MENCKNSCADRERMLPYMCLGYAYVFPQSFANLYTVNDALANGTLFKDLNIPITEYGK